MDPFGSTCIQSELREDLGISKFENHTAISKLSWSSPGVSWLAGDMHAPTVAYISSMNERNRYLCLMTSFDLFALFIFSKEKQTRQTWPAV